jgi:signal transduction histidine kinase
MSSRSVTEASEAPDTQPSAATRRRAVYASSLRGRWIAGAVSLLALLGFVLLLQALTAQQVAPLRFAAGPQGQWIAAAPSDAPGAAGVLAVAGFHDPRDPSRALAPRPPGEAPRWLGTQAARQRYFIVQEQLAVLFAQPQVALRQGDGSTRVLPLSPRGFGGVSAAFWLAGLLGLALVVIAAASFSTAPVKTNGLFLCACFCIALGGWATAFDLSRGIAWPPGWAMPIFCLGQAADVAALAALFAVVARYPVMTRLGDSWPLPLAVAAAGGAALLYDPTGLGWWLSWGLGLAFAAGTVFLLLAAQRLSPNPASHVLSRWVLGVFAAAVLIAVALGQLPGFAARHEPYLLDAEWLLRCLLMLLLAAVPFLSRTQYLFRQLILLLVVSGLVVVLDVAFISWFSLSQQTSLVVALLVSFWMYVPFRHWIVARWLGHGRLTSPQLFERLYAVTRMAELSPPRASELWTGLLRDLFQPMDVSASLEPVDDAELRAEGELLVAALPMEPGSIVLRYADEGKRLFSPADVSLVKNALGQVRGALALQQAVRKGRAEERERIARDLHDDIGAKLLTLMYRAPDKEVEDYARRAIQDLKTLVRGLALPGSTLEDSAAEWKAELSQRLAASKIALDWQQQLQGNPPLTAEQWSALTRIIRELGSNTIQHANARNVYVTLAYAPHELDIVFTDDGDGPPPESWQHGLGVGGIRKRIGKLGGAVQWAQALPQGVSCHISLPLAAAPYAKP